MPPTAPPEFLRYSPADIVKMGRERGTAPEQIAQAVTKHRDNIAAYGQQMHGQRFNEALPRLQQETNTALEELKPGFGVGDTLSGIGSMLGGLTTTVPAAYYGVTEGFTRPDQYSPEARAAFDANTAYQQRMQQESQQRLERGEASSTGDAFRSAGPSLGGTVGSMAAAIPASIAGAKGGALLGGAIGSAVPGPGTAVGATVGGVFGGGAAAMAAAGGVAYRMAGQQFLNDAFTALQKQRGGQMSEAEMQQAYNELLPLAENSALWEAGPEAIGNAVSLGTAKIVFGLGKPLLQNLAKTALGKAGVKVGAIAGSQAVELGGETATALGQGVTQAQADAYARGDPNWQQARSGYDRPGGTLQALKDIAPATLAMGATTLGAGGVVKLTTLPFQKPNDPLSPNQTPAPAGTPQAPGATPGAAPLAGAAGPVPSTLSRIAQESLVPDLPEDTGSLTAEEVADLEVSGATFQVSSSNPLPTVANPDPAQTITGSNVQMGTEMPVPLPTAEAGAGAGAMVAAQPVAAPPNELLTPELETLPPPATPQAAPPTQTDAQPVVPELLTPAQLQSYGQAQDIANAQARLDAAMAAQDRGAAELAMMTLTGAKAGSGPLATRAVRAQDEAVTLAILSARPVNAVAMERWAQYPATNAIGPDGNIPRRGIPAKYAKQGDVYVHAEAAQAQDTTIRQGLQNLQGGNRSNAGSTTLPGAAADALVNLASAAVRAGQTFAQWATSMLQRFGEAVRQYLQGAWQAAMRTSEVGAVDIFNGKVRGMTTSAVEVLHNDSTTLAKPKSKVSNDEVAKALQDAAVEQWGEIITSDNITPEQEAILVANGTDEFVAAFRASGKTAADWYTTNIESAMAVANVIHEELKSDQAAQAVKVNGQPIFRNKEDAQLALYLAMAITSQNLNVNQNTTYAEEQFQIFKATGKFDTSRLYGEKAKSISANLDLANNVLKELGWQDLHQIIKTTYTVRELSSILSKWTGKNVKIAGRLGDQVQGAAIFGPKIGQGFLQNLMGNYLPVTIDLWMRRTWGRWTGDVLGDGLTGERLARLTDEVRNIGLPLPTSLARMRPVVRKTEKGKSFRTMSEEFMDRVEVEEDLREQLNDYAKEIVTAWGRKYNAVQSGITKAQMDGLLTGTMSMDAVATTTLRNEESLNTQWEAKANKPKGKGAKETWKAAQRDKNGRSYKLTTDQWNGTVNGVKNVGPKLKPQWALAANVIRTQLKPIDAPSDQDRAVISRIVNKIRVELEAQGITVSNADIQAVLWYPEKDLWAKLRGEEESNLKQSYEDEFLKLARERGIGIEAEAAAARVRAARTGGPADQNTNGGISQGSVSAGKTQGGGFKNLNVSGRTAGFLNTDILNEATDLLRSGITDFANWSRAMVSRFGRAIQEFLAGIWQQITSPQTNAAQNVRMGRAQGTAPVTLGNSGAVLNPAAAPSRAASGTAAAPNETQSRFASPNEAARVINGPRTDAMVAEQAQLWLDSVDTQTAVEQFVAQAVPLPLDAAEHAAALLISRLSSESTAASTEVQRLWTHVQSQRMARVWTREFLSADPARAMRQRGVVNNTILQPIAPVMAAQGILVDRADAVMDKRFEGGGAGAVEKITNILNNVQGDITERVEAILNAVMGARLKPRVTIREAVAGLVNGKTQRDEMIDDVARALLQKAKSSQVKPEQKTALAALVASLKRTLGAAVRGTALKPDALSFGELLARTFVDQVAEAPLFEESWKAGREQVRIMLIELGMTESAALKRLNELMPATPTVAYAPGMVKQAVQRGFEAAGYGQTLATGADQSGQRAVDVRAEVLRNPQKAMAAVLSVWDAEAQAGGISPEAWAQGRQLAVRALNETLQQWQQQAAETTAKAAEATKNRLLAKDSPALAKLLKELTAKIAPGMTWTEIFTDMPSTQKARQKEIYRRLMLDERLRGLTQDERLALTNELDKAWQRERRKVFNRELEKAGVIGEKDKTDRVKVQKALPKLLRMINLGMFNSEMWREAVAPEYGLRMLTAADTAQLRTLAEAAWKLPEGVIRNQKLRDVLNAIQKKTGASRIEVLNSYWTAAVLSGLRTQFDTYMAAINGMGTNLMQIGGLIARGQGRAAIDAHAQWWRGLMEGVRESGQILFKGDTSYLKRFGADLKKALEGETSVTPVPLGENLWKNGNTFQKYGLAPVMMFTGRLMAAADHINNTATTQGAIAVARALHPELYQGRVGFTVSERADARTQALREVTGGAEPKPGQERATVSARTREILNGTVRPADYAAASEIGDMAAYQNDPDPTGVFGIVYSAMKQGLGSIQRGLGDYAQDVTANRFARVISGLMAGSLHGITGTRFMRFGANFGADLTRYIPGSYVLGKAGFYGRDVSRMQQELLLGKNLVGLMLASTLAAVFLNSDDEDEGWQIEGDWSTLNPQQAKERMAAGYERLTMWKREGNRIRRVSYKQWPTMGLFAVVGGMLDEKRHKPASWAERGTAGHLLRGVATGYVQVKNVSAVRNLVELFGEPSFSADAVTSTLDQMIKTGANFAGGFMPTLIKDAETWTDPRNFKPEGAAELMLRSMPIARKFVNDGRPQLNLLGEEVKLQRAPWSRSYTSVESGEAHRVLGALLARGLTLPMPSDQVTVIKDNVRVPLETLGRDAVWRYEKAVGQGYKDWLSLEGSDLLKLPVQEADARIKARSAAIKARAKASVVK